MKERVREGKEEAANMWPFAVGLQDQAANHHELPRSRAGGGEHRWIRRDMITSGEGRQGERKRTADDVSKA
jgi:hypothetical protein